MVIKEAQEHCVIEGITHVCLQIDSLVLLNVLTKVWKISWNIAVIVDDIKKISQMSCPDSTYL